MNLRDDLVSVRNQIIAGPEIEVQKITLAKLRFKSGCPWQQFMVAANV